MIVSLGFAWVICMILLFISLYSLQFVLYNLFFHPLRAFPGPTLAAATGLYKAWYDLIQRGELLHHLGGLHKTYGPVIRIGPNEIHFNDPQAYFDIYHIGSTLTKEPGLYKCFAMDQSSFTFTDPEKSKHRRALISPLFSRRAILSLEGVIQSNVDKFISRLASHPSDKPINMFWAFRCASLDIISSYIFAHCLNTLDAEDFAHPLPISIQAQVQALWVWKYFPFIIPSIMAMPDWLVDKLRPLLGVLGASLAVRRQVSAHIDSFLADKGLLESVEHEVVYHHLIRQGIGKGRVEPVPSKESILAEALILLQAGSDTVGSTCYVGCFYILNDATVRQKLHRELRDAWPDVDSPISVHVLEKLPFLNAVIKESLRLAHGVVTPLPRVVGSSGAEIQGVTVPAGTVVGTSCTFLHNAVDVFPAPQQFTPERWFGPNVAEMDKYLVPFSRGPRMCIGINLAWAELYLIIGHLFRKLDLEIHQTTPDDFKRFKEMFVPVFEGRHLHVIVNGSYQ